MKRIIYFLLLLLPPLAASAERVQIGELWYNLDAVNKTAEVTHDGSVFWSMFDGYRRNNYYTGDITIPEAVDYEETAYEVTAIGEAAFAVCKELTSVLLPNTLITIGEDAFWESTGLTSLAIPKSVKYIKSGAFDKCENLQAIHISDLDAWFHIVTSKSDQNDLERSYSNTIFSSDHHLYLNGEEIKDLVIPEGITKIGDWLFAHDCGITSITMPSSLEEIGWGSFWYCKGLKSISIPKTVKSIKDRSFEGCSGLTNVTLEEGLTEIGNRMFFECTGLPSIVIPGSILAIGNDAFNGCQSLTTVDIREGLIAIGNSAFQNCTKLTSIYLPQTLTTMGYSVFYKCSGITSASVHGGIKELIATFDACTNLKTVTLSEGVQSLNSTFRDCIGLTSINIPNSVDKLIGAFEGCTNLTTVTLGSGISVLNAFKNCTSLTEIVIPEKVTVIGGFEGCTNLKTVSILGKATTIGENAFANCQSLSSIELPNTISDIWFGAFSGCVSLETINLPESLNAINNRTFENCTSLTSIEIPKNILSIQYNAFQNCSGLKTVTIPMMPRFEYFNNLCFDGCTNIMDVYMHCEKVPDSYNYPVFTNCYSQYATLHVPDDLVDDFKGSECWNHFGHIVPLDQERCATPSITFYNGRLEFDCATEGAEFVSEITDEATQRHLTGEITDVGTYRVSVYAKAKGYRKSETVTGTLRWMGSQPVLTITTGKEKTREEEL